MANIEARRKVYDALGGDSACDSFYKGKGGQKLGVADKFLINQVIDKYVEEYRSKIGEDPRLNHNNDIAFFSPRVEQYGFEVPVADWTMRKSLKIAERHRRTIKKKQEQEKKVMNGFEKIKFFVDRVEKYWRKRKEEKRIRNK